MKNKTPFSPLGSEAFLGTEDKRPIIIKDVPITLVNSRNSKGFGSYGPGTIHKDQIYLKYILLV